MPLTDEQDERLTLILQGLEGEIKAIYPSGRNFVEDQIRRHQQYGEGIRLSVKQWNWLEDLYTQFVGELPEGNRPDEDREPQTREPQQATGHGDPDDDIPF